MESEISVPAAAGEHENGENQIVRVHTEGLERANGQESAAIGKPRPGLSAVSTVSIAMTPSKAEQYAKIFMASGLFKDVKSIYQAMVKIMAGAELGFPPFSSMSMVDIIEGQVGLKPVGMRSLILRGGKYDYSVDELTNDAASISFYRIEGENRVFLGKSVFTQDDAKRAMLADKGGQYSMYRKYPRNMLLNRATANGVRWYCPDIALPNMYLSSELSPELDEAEDGEALVLEQGRTKDEEIKALLEELGPFMPPTVREEFEQRYWSNESDDDLIDGLMRFKSATFNQKGEEANG